MKTMEPMINILIPNRLAIFLMMSSSLISWITVFYPLYSLSQDDIKLMMNPAPNILAALTCIFL